MVSTFAFHEGNGAAPGTFGSVANLNTGSSDSKELVTSTYPVIAGQNSYEKWFVGSWGGTFSKINNVQFWKSNGAYVTGEVVKWGSSTTYVRPTTTTSTVALGSVPIAAPGSQNVLMQGTLTGSIVTTGSSGLIVLQTQSTVSVTPGAANTKTYTIQWDEQ
jgi:hypothetical protein